MADLLQFNDQPWKLWSSDGLSFVLPRSREPDRIYLNADWLFVHPDLDPKKFSRETPVFQLSVIVPVPDLHDWRDLANRTLGGDDDDDPDDDDALFFGPDLFAHPPKLDPNQRPDGWGTQMIFGDRDDYEFEFEMTAWRPTDRARAANNEFRMKQITREKLPPDWEGRDWLEETHTLSFSGRIELNEFLCNVPVNTAQPVEWAKQLARRELQFHEFGFCHVNGGDWIKGTFQPSDGIGQEGRLVVLTVANAYFYDWQKKNQPKR